jgi:N-glycosylase/DNA lyase
VREHQPVTVESIRATHKARRKEIRAKLVEFEEVWRKGTDARLWEELVFCIFTAGASARMGLKSIEAVRPLLLDGQCVEMTRALKNAGAHRFPVARPGYIVIARNYLREHCELRLREQLQSFSDPVARRDWLAQEKQIKGLGYKEASHFLRNIGLKGHAILDKHVLRCLVDLKVVETARPPSTRARYLEIEEMLRGVARDVNIDFDELDLVLWSLKTGEVLK